MFSQSFESIISISYYTSFGIFFPQFRFSERDAKISAESENIKCNDEKAEIYPMFTGIIECQGIIKTITETGSNKTFWIKSTVSPKLKINQSISHDGVCLTVEEVKKNRHRVTAIEETLKKTTLGNWQPGQLVNIERCLKLNARLDGHFVQGHVDVTAICTRKIEKDRSEEHTSELQSLA